MDKGCANPAVRSMRAAHVALCAAAAGFFALFVPHMVIARSHFQPVEPTGIPYHVVVASLSMQGGRPETGTEIGLFDDSLCVGATAVADSASGSFDVVAWQANPLYNLKGFTVGHSIIIKIWTIESGVWKEFPVQPQFSVGTGLFGAGAYSVISIALTSTSVPMRQEPVVPESIHLYGAYPNPFNGAVTIVYDASEEITAFITSVTGQRVRQFLLGAGAGRKKFIWNATDGDGSPVASGIYILSLHGKHSVVSTKLLLLM